MATPGDWKIPASIQPKAGSYAYDLDRALSAVVALSTRVPDEAFTAETLGTERAGNGVVIGEDGLVLTIGYLVTEAESVWLTTNDGRSVPGHVMGFDAATGFGLVQALGPLGVPALKLGSSGSLKIGDRAVVAGAGGRQRCVAAQIVARQEFIQQIGPYRGFDVLFVHFALLQRFAPNRFRLVQPHFTSTRALSVRGTTRGASSSNNLSASRRWPAALA